MMLNLGDYFHPLSFYSFFIFVICFFILDSIGFLVAKKASFIHPYLRSIYWLLGLGIWIFTWFCLHFWLTFESRYIWTTLFIFGCLALPTYVKEKGYKSLWKCVRTSPWPFVLILPLIPIVWVKISMPPYYFDEMAYQYYSPRNYLDLPTWDFFQAGLYQNLPRLLNTGYYLMFGLTKSYALARLLHFSIFFTVFWSIHLWMRKRFGTPPSIFFLALYWYLPIDLMTTSTLGYVDIAAVSLITLGVLLLVDNIIYRSKTLLPAAAIWSLALGIKYTSSVTLVATGVVWLFFFLLSAYRERKLNIDLRKIFAGFVLCLFLGGYWYVKNTVLFWSPTYPFVLPCKPGLVEKCQTTNSFFSGWTVPINLANTKEIASQLSAGKKMLVVAFALSTLMLFFKRKYKYAKTGLLILLICGVELIILKNLSGFYLRYNQHLQVLFAITLCAPVVSLSDKKWRSLTTSIYTLMLAILILIGGYKTLRYYYYLPGYIQRYELDYAMGKSDIWNWMDKKFTKTNTVIRYCNDVKSNTTLMNVDPDLIWFEFEGMMRVFLTNCVYRDNPLGGYRIDELKFKAIENKMDFLFPSINPCVVDEKIRRLPYENENQKHLRKVNNWLVCNSKEVVPYLYSFNYKDLK